MGIHPKWPQERVVAVRKYLSAGLSSSKIADRLCIDFPGSAYTRNAVIGVVFRNGLTRKKIRPIVRKKRSDADNFKPAKSRQDAKPSRAKVRGVETNGVPNWEYNPEPIEFSCDEVLPLKLTLLELPSDGCKWPYGGWVSFTEREPITFCGHTQSISKSSPYCPAHAQLSWRPGSNSERRAAYR